MNTSCKLRCGRPQTTMALLTFLVAGCPVRTHVPAASPVSPAAPVAPHVGAPYDVVPAESLLTIRVYRGGTLASAGHNHLIACHDLSGTIYVPAEPLRGSFAVRIPVTELSVDEAPLREQEMSDEFPPDVPDAAREGTRHNMLSAALLDAEHYPEILLQALRLDADAEAQSGAAAGPPRVLAQMAATVRGETRTVSVPVSYQLDAGQLIASGAVSLRQSDLGLTPFSALLGALQVQDEMRIRFRIVARAAAAGSRR